MVDYTGCVFMGAQTITVPSKVKPEGEHSGFACLLACALHPPLCFSLQPSLISLTATLAGIILMHAVI